MNVLGIDIGGSGIKGAPVDTKTGELCAERHRIETPQPATPRAVVDTVAKIVEHFEWKGAIGVGIPAAVQEGVVRTAANIDKGWIGTDAIEALSKATGIDKIAVLNDADAAGYAEMHFGAGRKKSGVVIIVTLGTGIGTGFFVNGHLVPNTELGHIEIDGMDAETWAADSVRKRKQLSWKKWAKRVDTYLNYLQRYFWPDLFVIGGGVSKKSDKFLPRLTVPTPVVAAELLNEAGIVGAALAYTHQAARSKQTLSLG
ncbi:MAG: ROK family protein [Myxococcales bacterium]|nr:ROK family protein [Myxococcales bacterium]